MARGTATGEAQLSRPGFVADVVNASAEALGIDHVGAFVSATDGVTVECWKCGEEMVFGQQAISYGARNGLLATLEGFFGAHVHGPVDDLTAGGGI